MNLSLKRRIGLSFVVANVIVLIMGFTVFYFLDTLNRQVEKITTQTNSVSLLTDEVRISAVSILKTQKKIITNQAKRADIDFLVSLCEGFQSQLQRLDTFYDQQEVKKIIGKMQGYVEALMSLASKMSLNSRDNAQSQTIGELADKILEAFSEFQDIQYFQNELRDKQIQKIIEDTRRNMLITLIITFLGTILLGLIIPGKISLPFKKINDAIRELQECNFDVSIYYDQDDEIGELAQEINKMIVNFKTFEELRADRINVELRKFDALANMSRRHILVANAQGELIYMNNAMYSLLELQSQDVLNKSIHDTLIPDSIIDAYELAIKRRSKIENAEILIPAKHFAGEDEVHAVKEDFQGYANVIPIRGKKSSLDYYLMAVSNEVFA
jgi:nitrogen fixation/metabolism regulation signal transduction histidine kinase